MMIARVKVVEPEDDDKINLNATRLPSQITPKTKVIYIESEVKAKKQKGILKKDESMLTMKKATTAPVSPFKEKEKK